MSQVIWEKYGGNKKDYLCDEIIADIENRVGFYLPEDYKLFAKRYLGFGNEIGPEYVDIWDSEEIIEFNTDYEVFSYLKDGLGIGSNGSSEMIALKKIDDTEFKILLVPFLDLEEEETFIEIGNSFTDFFERLELGIEWFK